MKKVIYTGLLAYHCISLLVSAHPYSPYTDVDKSKNMEWSQEAVVTFLKNKMEKENLPPASISEYILTLIQGKKPKDKTNTRTGPCVDGGTTDSLQREQLEMILDTVYPITGSPTPYTTLLTPDHGINMYANELSPLTAYQVMLGARGIGDASNIWTNYSPCPTCVHALLDKYNKPEDEKPTIHVAGIYTESNSLSHIMESLECLGKLVHSGFSIVPWNFDEFKAPEDVPVFLNACNLDIDTYYRSSNFTSAYMRLESLVTFIQQLGANPNANSWCTV